MKYYFVSFLFDYCLNLKTAKKFKTHTHKRIEPLVTIAKHALNSPHHIPFSVCESFVWCVKYCVCKYTWLTVLCRQRCWCLWCYGCRYCCCRRHRFNVITSCLTHTLRSYFACCCWFRLNAPYACRRHMKSGNICPYMDASMEWWAGAYGRTVNVIHSVYECVVVRAYPHTKRNCFKRVNWHLLCSIWYLLSRTVICLCSGVVLFSFLPALGARKFIVGDQFAAFAQYIWTFRWRNGIDWILMFWESNQLTIGVLERVMFVMMRK